MGDEWENEVLCTAFSVVSLFLSCKLKVCIFLFFFFVVLRFLVVLKIKLIISSKEFVCIMNHSFTISQVYKHNS